MYLDDLGHCYENRRVSYQMICPYGVPVQAVSQERWLNLIVENHFQELCRGIDITFVSTDVELWHI